MKKKTVLKLLFIASCLVAMYSLFYSHETNTLDSLAFRILKRWPKVKTMQEPIATVSVQSIAEATK